MVVSLSAMFNGNDAQGQLLRQQIFDREERNRAAAGGIPDAAVIPVGSGRFNVLGGDAEPYRVDLWGPSYPVCSCKWWLTNNRNTLKAQGVAVRCKHILKVERWVRDRTP